VGKDDRQLCAEFYAKCNRTVVHTSSMPLLLSTRQ
jgi:hypothetical protein